MGATVLLNVKGVMMIWAYQQPPNSQSVTRRETWDSMRQNRQPKSVYTNSERCEDIMKCIGSNASPVLQENEDNSDRHLGNEGKWRKEMRM